MKDVCHNSADEILKHNNTIGYQIDLLFKLKKSAVLISKGGYGTGKTMNIKSLSPILKRSGFLCVGGSIEACQKQFEDFKSLGAKFHRKYEAAIHKDETHLIVNIDTLYKVPGRYIYLILDDFNYFINQLVNNSTEKRSNVHALIDRIKDSPFVIISDAYITDEMVRIIKFLRQDVIIREDIFQAHTNKQIYVIMDQLIWFDMIFRDILQGKKLVICCGSSTDIALKLNKLLCDLCKTICYTSSTSIIGNVHEKWKDYDCFIYSSILEAAICFDELHFDKIYGHFSTLGVDPASAAQMLFRTRQCKTGDINIYVEEAEGNDPFPADIRTFQEARNHILNMSIPNCVDDLPSIIAISYAPLKYDLNHLYIDIYATVKYRKHIEMQDYLWSLLEIIKIQGVKLEKIIDEKEYKIMCGFNDVEFNEYMYNIMNITTPQKSHINYGLLNKISKKMGINNLDKLLLNQKGSDTRISKVPYNISAENSDSTNSAVESSSNTLSKLDAQTGQSSHDILDHAEFEHYGVLTNQSLSDEQYTIEQGKTCFRADIMINNECKACLLGEYKCEHCNINNLNTIEETTNGLCESCSIIYCRCDLCQKIIESLNGSICSMCKISIRFK